MNYLVLILSATRLIPHLLVFSLIDRTAAIDADLDRWTDIVLNKKKTGIYHRFLLLMTFFPEFRNLFYYRVGAGGKFLCIFCRPMNTLFLASRSIGPGLFIQHGFSTIIAARSIGKNCWINQQVTIGYSNETDCPDIGDNVTICAGAKVIGGVTIGENSKVGANAVVIKNVPANVTVVGVPARIVRRNSRRVDEAL